MRLARFAALALCSLTLISCADDACVEGERCTPPGEGNACRDGVWRCELVTASGVEPLPHCEPAEPLPAGVSCGAGGTCDGTGACIDCSEGTSCDTTNPCAPGAVDCSGSAPRCVPRERRPAGEPCGVSGVCNEAGFCAECADPPFGCDTGESCTRGEVRCDGGPPACVPVPLAAGTPCSGSERGSCDGEGRCLPCGGADVEAACSDGLDDDCDGQTDCDDPDCDAQVCDDGVFCNGPDACAAGSCSDHLGDPCSGSGVCDEAASTCTCATDADCPGETRGPLGACTHPTDVCVRSASRAQTVSTFTCVAGTCEVSMSTDAIACTRSTTGDSCGDITNGPWGACSYASTCAQMETESRDTSTPSCRVGACRVSTGSETRACGSTRDTDGNSCATSPWSPMTSCAGFADPCDESGTRTWARTVGTCSGGGCSTSTETEVRSCTRASTDGDTCSSCVGGACACVAQLCMPMRTVDARETGGDPRTGPGITVTCLATGATCTAHDTTCAIQCPEGSGVDIACMRGAPCDIEELTAIGGASTTCMVSAYNPRVCSASCSAVVGAGTLDVTCDPF